MNIPEYRTASELASDLSFVQWVLHPHSEQKNSEQKNSEQDERDEQWSAWIIAQPDRANIVAEARLYVLAAHTHFQSETMNAPHASKDRIRQAVFQNIQSKQKPHKNKDKKSTPAATRPRRAWYYWAVALVVVGCGLGVMRYSGMFDSPTVIAVEAASGANASRSVTLPDGSTVVVGASSELTFKADEWQRTGSARELTLTGEAFFVVQKQERAGQPIKFRVRTANVVVEVVGTQFNVNTRHERTAVVLQEGKVRVVANDGATPLAELRPNERAEINAQGAVTKRAVRAAVYTSWKDGKLIFEATPLAEVARVLEDRYNTSVVLDKTLADRTFTGAAPLSNVDLLLRAIGEAFNARVTRSDGTITIRPQ